MGIIPNCENRSMHVPRRGVGEGQITNLLETKPLLDMDISRRLPVQNSHGKNIRYGWNVYASSQTDHGCRRSVSFLDQASARSRPIPMPPLLALIWALQFGNSARCPPRFDHLPQRRDIYDSPWNLHYRLNPLLEYKRPRWGGDKIA